MIYPKIRNQVILSTWAKCNWGCRSLKNKKIIFRAKNKKENDFGQCRKLDFTHSKRILPQLVDKCVLNEVCQMVQWEQDWATGFSYNARWCVRLRLISGPICYLFRREVQIGKTCIEWRQKQDKLKNQTFAFMKNLGSRYGLAQA